ncbi:MAG: AAA family ATPase [Ruminococcus sp.]|nr:AAA family ATPase [Ruminococcus sp.]
MSLFGFALGVTAVAVVGIAAAVICDRLSSQEESRQQRMRDDYDSYCSDRRYQYESTVSGYRSSYESKREGYIRNFAEERKRAIEELQNRNRPYLNEILENLNEQRNTKKNDLNQLLDVLKQWEKIKDKSQSTMLRMKSIKTTMLSIEEACYKLQAYLCYLNRYEHNMKHHFDRDGSIPEPFSMTLPKYYPYAGKIIDLKKSDFYLKNDRYIYEIPDEKNLTLFLDISEKEQFEMTEYETIPFMVCYNKHEDKLAQTISLRKAKIKLSINGTQGIYAEVEKVSNNWITLSYNGIYLSLNRSDLLKPTMPLPKGTYRTVFLTEYDFALKKRSRVSENIQDSLSLASFESIAMVMTFQQYNDLYNLIQKNNWINLDGEWKVSPFFPDESPLKTVKFQLGDYYGYVAEFQKVDGKNNSMLLKFIRMLEKDEFITFTDVFAVADVQVKMYPDMGYDLTDVAEECAFLYTYLTGEFASQQKILQSSPMMLYLDKWLELTRRLIEVLQYKQKITLEIDYCEQHGKTLYLYISNPDKGTKKFIDKALKTNRPRFILSIPGDKQNEYLKCNVEQINETDELLVTVKGLEFQNVVNLDFRLDLILLSNVYAEKSQTMAFSDFREGNISCMEIKETILHSSDLIYHDTENRILSLYKAGINNNEQQFIAVHKAFAVEDFYMIQGPPGTGKTTVIKELIMQQIHYKPDSRILIVSQANVAVDNVLRGIQELCRTEKCISESQIIRCGSDDKIAEDIQSFSYEGRLNNYAELLKTSPAKNMQLREKWIKFTQDSDNKNIVGECLLRGYQIIGATCVGFANRNVGLSGLEFELVIIDEAGKALPGELLIPINHAKKLILIGDHKQLPPVVNPEFYTDGSVETDDVLEEDEHLDFFNKSFFERLWLECPESNKCMLNTQFRMPPIIAGLVNLFYDGQLRNGSVCSLKTPIAFDSHLVMLDMKNEPDYYEEQKPDSGPYNIKEQEVVINLIHKLRTVYTADKRIVVITPYKKQKKELIYKMKDSDIRNFSVNTIDAFQGDEEDIVIYCMTRSRKPTDYFSDSARLNVAFSRAKNLLIIIGSTDYLKRYGKEHILNHVFQYIQNYGRIVPYSEFIDENFSIMNIQEHFPEYVSEETKTNLTVYDVFNVKTSEQVSVYKCQACGGELHDKNAVLCLNCLNESDICVCSECHKKFEYPRYLVYIEKQTPPTVCESCRTVSVICSNCHKSFPIQHSYYENLKKTKKQILCTECRNEILVPCDQCGKAYYTVKWMYDNFHAQNKKCFCNECRNNENVNCQCCGKIFQIPGFRRQQTQKEGKKLYCPECCQKTDVSCDRCGRNFEINLWILRDIRSKRKGCICPECRRR